MTTDTAAPEQPPLRTRTTIGQWLTFAAAAAAAAAAMWVAVLLTLTLTAIGELGGDEDSARVMKEAVCVPYVSAVLARHAEGYTPRPRSTVP